MFYVLLTVRLSIILDNDQPDTLALFYNTFIIILYMFRALYAHHQEVNCIDAEIWYRPLSQWPSGAQVERELRSSSLSTCAPDDHLLRVTIPDAASIQFSLLMMSI